MGKKSKRILAIVALVFIGLFTVSFVAFLVDKTLFNGAIGFFALFTGGVGLALFFVIKLSRDNTDVSDPDDKTGQDRSTEKNDDSDNDDSDKVPAASDKIESVNSENVKTNASGDKKSTDGK